MAHGLLMKNAVSTYPRDAISLAGLREPQNTAERDDGERRNVVGGSAARVIPRLAGVARAL